MSIYNMAEQNRTEQNRTEQNRTEQNRTEQNVFAATLNPALSGDIIIYGAGVNCIRLLIRLINSGDINRMNVLSIVDADVKKQGSRLFGFSIGEPSDLEQYDKNTPVIITPQFYGVGLEIMNRLKGMGFRSIFFVNKNQTDQLQNCVGAVIENYNSAKDYWDGLLAANTEKLEFIRSRLADGKSRECLDALVASRFELNFARLTDLIEPSNNYNPAGLFEFKENEVFLDCGAYDGGSAEQFSKIRPDYRRIYSFEPDPKQYLLTKAYLNAIRLDRAEVFPLGVYSSAGEISFSGFGGGGGIVADDDKAVQMDNREDEIEVETVSLDELLYDKEERVTFIKMDIEGVELEALKGARKMIGRDFPKLAICLYHKPQDAWEIPYWILTNFPQYKVYIRQHAVATDTVMYCTL